MTLSVRARTALSLTGLAVYVLLAVGSFGGPTTVPTTLATIIRHRQLLFSVAEMALTASQNTTSSVDEAYRELGEYMAAEGLSTEQITRMESTRDALKIQADSLRYFLSATEANADQLFGMLETRAKENQTEQWRTEMLGDIEAKREQFSQRLATAREAMNRIDASIQKYDDIVGYVQVNFGLRGIEQQIGQLDSFMLGAGALDQQIQVAINEGLQIIDSIPMPADAPDAVEEVLGS